MNKFTYLIILSLCLFQFSCAPTDEFSIDVPIIHGGRMTSANNIELFIGEVIKENGLLAQRIHVDIDDNDLFILTKEDFKSVIQAMFDVKPIYQTERFDCDDFANLFHMICVLGNQSDYYASPAVGVLTAQIKKTWANIEGDPTGKSTHQLNFVVVEEDNEQGFEVYIVEPQNLIYTSYDKYPNLKTIFSIEM